MKTLIETVRVTDERGETRQLSIYQNWVHSPLGNSLPGTKEVLDEDGRHVSTTDGISFQIVVTGEKLTRV
jgi:hypothetical protein